MSACSPDADVLQSRGRLPRSASSGKEKIQPLCFKSACGMTIEIVEPATFRIAASTAFCSLPLLTCNTASGLSASMIEAIDRSLTFRKDSERCIVLPPVHDPLSSDRRKCSSTCANDNETSGVSSTAIVKCLWATGICDGFLVSGASLLILSMSQVTRSSSASIVSEDSSKSIPRSSVSEDAADAAESCT